MKMIIEIFPPVGGGGGGGYLLRGVVSYAVSMWDFIVAKEGSKKEGKEGIGENSDFLTENLE
jgi:hypothetical protein